MNFELSLFPVLGGYWLVTHLNLTRTDALRRSGYHVAFQSAFWGFMLLVPAYPIALGLCDLYPAILPELRDRAAILSLVLGIVLPTPLNKVLYSQRDAEKRIAEEHGDLVELLIVEAIERATLIEISLRGGKVYIGFPLANRIARWTGSHVSMLPMSSGYRNKDTLELEITTDYAPVISDYLETTQDPTTRVAEKLRDFRVVIPRSEIVSARLFDPDLHQQFRAAAGRQD